MTANAAKQFCGVARVVLLLVLALATGAPAQLAKPTLPPVAAKPPASQTIPTGFDDLGFVQYASVDQMCDPVSAPPLDNNPNNPATPAVAPPPPTPAGCKTAGGWLQINNNVIRIPQNTVVFFPNAYYTWEEVFEFNPGAVVCTAPGACTLAPPVPGESGLALSDTVRSPYTFQAHVQGQIVNGQYIAGIVQISQDSLQGTMGFIESINYADGSFVVNGRKMQINDPVLQITDMAGNLYNKGRFSIGQSPDIRFTSDQGNITVRAQTGYPMCIPRAEPGKYSGPNGIPNPSGVGFDDPQCPELNRPRDAAGNLVNLFTMNAPGGVPFYGQVPQDPWTAAPFEVGDFVTVKGTQFQDLTGQPYLSVNEVVGNVGIYTAHDIDPAYIVIEVAIQGTGGVPNPAFPQEAARRTVVDGFTTDDFRNVDISAIDTDCNGNLSFRFPGWVYNFPVQTGPPLVGIRGRWRFRPGGGAFLPPTQNVGAQISGGWPLPNNNGIITDSYQLPDLEFIFPEGLGPGAAPVTYNFADLPFLVNGTGPWPLPSNVYDSQLLQMGFPRAETPIPQQTQTIGQLLPFPDASPPPLGCIPNTSPGATAQAVATFTATSTPIVAGTVVTLSAAGSTPATGPFSWQQIVNPGDPIVTLSNTSAFTASFVAPVVSAPLNLSFQLTVGGGNTTTPATANLSVPIAVPPPGTPPSVTALSAPANPVTSFTIVTLTASGVDPSGGTLTYTWVAPPGITLTPAAPDGSVQTFSAPLVPTGSAPQSFTFAVTATSSTVGLAPSKGQVTVVVNPQFDVITITSVAYVSTKARLTVTVVDTTPGVTLTCTLDIINPATGLPYSGVMGPALPPAPGTYSIIFTNLPIPEQVTITSSAGGVATSPVTILR